MTIGLVICAVLGWVTAVTLYIRQRRHRCLIDVPKWAVLVNYAGLPESCRALRGAPPVSFSRPRGKGAATDYARVGNAALYKATTARQPQ